MFTKCHFRSQKVWGRYSLIFQIVSYKKVILLMREFFSSFFSWESVENRDKAVLSHKKSSPRLLLRTTIFVWGTQQIVRFFIRMQVDSNVHKRSVVKWKIVTLSINIVLKNVLILFYKSLNAHWGYFEQIWNL